MKLITLLSVLSLMIAPTAISQTVYSWVDDDGILHISDTPPDGAAKQKDSFVLPDSNASAPAPVFAPAKSLKDKKTAKAKATEKANATEKQESKKPEKMAPLSISISNLQQDQTLRSNRGIINIQVEQNRKLGIGEQLQLMLDGKPYGAPQTKPLWQLINVDRGTHVLAVQAVIGGKLIASTSPVTVHLHRARVKSAG
ncbi:DUF4124 domain-containing protein [Vibrio sp. SCSIO 43132]|uniref:DUF4124 domain-containing protein n=1 Tax=Vibrio sp. SCSIO 43132 TaxID=2779363 RepID=UPI001CA8A0C0|nr:DUF4124 domain-containing protein [Vibrio sp. SCSIO 43132]UAB70279.1 DUF4124 domain-containing protein [Vibrio sp. SCSIO 43132]